MTISAESNPLQVKPFEEIGCAYTYVHLYVRNQQQNVRQSILLYMFVQFNQGLIENKSIKFIKIMFARNCSQISCQLIMHAEIYTFLCTARNNSFKVDKINCILCPRKIKKNKKSMNILSQQQVLQYEIKILNTSGPTLANFYNYDPDHHIFEAPIVPVRQHIEQQHKLTNIKSSANGPNNILNSLTYIILHCVQEDESGRNKELVERIKGTLCSPSFGVEGVVGYPGRGGLGGNGMKKILVEFLQVLKYSTGELGGLLANYRVVLDIFTLFFRAILVSYKVKNAQQFNGELNNMEALTKLLDFFQISYQIRNNLIVFENRQLCLLHDDKTNKFYIGERIFDLSTKTSDLNLELIAEGQDETFIMKKDNYAFNTPTPCFGEVSWDDPMAKMQKNVESQKKQSLAEVQEEPYYPTCQKLKNSKVIHYDSEVHQEARKFKSILDSFPTSPVSLHQSPKKALTKNFMMPPNNPQKLKCSQIYHPVQEQQQDKKSSRSQNIVRKKTQEDQYTSYGKNTEYKLSNYEPDKNKLNKLESCVVELKIEPIQKRYKTNIFQECKQQKLKFNQNRNFNKIPTFLQKQTGGRVSSSNSPINHPPNAHRQQQKIKKPKVVFTYGQQKRNTTFSGYTPVEVSRVKYVTQGHDVSHSEIFYKPAFTQRNAYMQGPTSEKRSPQWQYFGP